MFDPSGNLPIVRDHRRQWRQCRYVYPVIGRRSKGLSVGVNLNPDKQCTFACVYCQVDRRTRRDFHEIDLRVLRGELIDVLGEAVSGRIWQDERFAATPPAMRRLNDLAFSGDGEPTLVPQFDLAVKIAADVLRSPACGLAASSPASSEPVKIVVITNATQFDQPQFQRALPVLDAHNGEIWAKLDAGTEEYFLRINRPYPRATLDHILRNIAAVARGRPIVIQSLFCRIAGLPPPEHEIAAYCRNLQAILHGGGKIKLIQAHTVARPPALSTVTALANAELDAIAQTIKTSVPVPVETYYGG